MKRSVHDLTNSVNVVSLSNDKLVAEVSQINRKLSHMDTVLALTDSNKYSDLLTKYNELNDRMVSLESYSRRDNLLFNGVKEEPNEDCAEKIYELLETTMGIAEARTMRLVRCHRLGKPPSTKTPTGTQSRPRTIICRFNWYGDRQTVWKAKTQLKDTEYNIQEDFPKEIMDKRKILTPIMYAAKRRKQTAFLVVDKLHVVTGVGDNKVTDIYDVNSLDKLPPALDPKYVSTVKKNKTFAFFGQNCPLSNFYPAPFVTGGETYRHVEEYFFVQKAELANDDVMKNRIRNAKTPADCKCLGYNIKIDKKRWEQQEVAVMTKALQEKFSQNPAVKDYLMQTADLTLAEASPSDKFWGTGVGLGKLAASKEKKFKWTGKNKLGELLMNLRTQYK
jgi:ribA/ribD-fused uncharacterized protein